MPACTLVIISTLVFYYVINLIGNQSTLEGFFKRKLPTADDNGNNDGYTSRTQRDGDGTTSNTNNTI